MADWSGKGVLVTGGSAGLGRAVAAAFVARGAAVTIAARNGETLEAAAGALRAGGGSVNTCQGDVTREEDVERIVADTVEQLGRLDVLVNAAGASDRGRAVETTPARQRELWELNFLGTVHAVRSAVPHLLATRGHVVNVGSLAGKIAGPYLGAYPASKFAVTGWTEQLRLEYTAEDLHVLLVAPGPLARDDAGERYDDRVADLPDAARRPGGGVRVRAIDPDWLAARIVAACERRRPELVVPGRARLLAAIGQLSPRLGDWIVRRMMRA